MGVMMIVLLSMLMTAMSIAVVLKALRMIDDVNDLWHHTHDYMLVIMCMDLSDTNPAFDT